VGDDVLFEVRRGTMEAPLHVNEGVRTSTIKATTVMALGLAGVIVPSLGLFPKLTQNTPHPHQLLTCHGQEYIASPKAREANYGRNL
jgi:hypothetical protein